MERWWENSSSFGAIQQLAYAKCLIELANPPALQPCIIWSVTLEPSLFPRSQYELVRELQPHFNSLVDSVSRDHEFLVQTFEKYVHIDYLLVISIRIYLFHDRISHVDDYVKQLFHIYMTVTKMEYKEVSCSNQHCLNTISGSPEIRLTELQY